ncbi:MAG: hypothetical protein U0X40_02595 [Ferruginibacter sp.]
MYSLLLLAMPFLLRAQAPNVYSAIDRNSILIGEPVNITLKTKIPSGNDVAPTVLVPDSIPHFEIVGLDKQETGTEAGGMKTFSQRLSLTSFDSGRWTIPALSVQLSRPDGSVAGKLQTDSFAVTVNYAPADSTGQLRDIKPIQEVDIPDYTWLFITGIVLLLMVVAFFIWQYLRRRKPAPLRTREPALTPLEEAMRALQALQQYDLTNAGDVKAWHSGLAGIFRTYLGRKCHRDLTAGTTTDILLLVKELPLTAALPGELATVLRCSDAVKFAKYLPPVYESEESLQKIKSLIGELEQALNKNNS